MARNANTEQRKAGLQQFKDPNAPKGSIRWDESRKRGVIGTGGRKAEDGGEK